MPYIARALVLSVTILLCSACSSVESAIDLESFASVRRAVAEYGDMERWPVVQHELDVIEKMISTTPPERRADSLRKMASRTRWGSPERATIYYVCAWYGVNYERCRDYLLNGLFEYGWDPNSYPNFFAFGARKDGSSDLRNLLYVLQSRNREAYLERQLLFWTGDERHWPAVKRELALVKKTVASTPPFRRAQALEELATRTKWGTPERAVAYYHCAWYGVNYERCRDYLLNALFGRGWNHPLEVFIWGEESALLLYHLYERNLDFRILHELLTSAGDGGLASMLDGIRLKALAEHPRGVLQVAGMSATGREFAESSLEDNLLPGLYRSDVRPSQRVFTSYVRRVAADSNDSLRAIARGLLTTTAAAASSRHQNSQ